MSPLVVIAIAAIILIALQFLIGMRSGAETRRVYAYLLQDARKRARRSFTVIVPLERRAETIIPLLDHLYSHGYDKIKIIVIVKRSAGSKAEQELQIYKRANRRKGLKFVQYKRGMNTAAIAKTLATSEYVITLMPSDRLSARFFEVTSQVLAATSPNALAVRSLVRPARTFAHALWSVARLFRTVKAGFTPLTMPSDVTIFKRTAIKNKQASPSLVYASSQFYSMNLEESRPIISWRVVFVAIAAGVLAAALFLIMVITLGMATAQLYGLIVFIAVEVTVLLCMLQVRGYRLVDYVNILLFIPLAPLYALGYGIVRLIKSLISAVRRPRLSAQQ